MKKCPFCGADIQDSAQFCLYCMQSLVEKEQILPHKKKKPLWLLLIVVIAGIFLTLIMILSSKQPTPNHGPSSDAHMNSTTSSNQTESFDPLHIHNYCVENTAIEYQKDAATCTTSAIFYYSCACGEKGSNTFSYGEPANHIIVTKTGYPATCKAPGLTDGKHCSVCNTAFLSQTQIPIISHTFDNNQDSTCNVCAYVRVLNCNHAKTVKLAAVPPTCTASGLTEGKKCSLCEEILAAQSTLAPLGHTEVADQAIAPTCTATGKTAGKHCSLCQIVLVYQQHLPALGHSFDPDDPLAVCSVCAIEPPHSHNYSVKNVIQEYQKEIATCLSPAVYYYSCTCGKKGTETFTYGEMGRHNFVDVPGYPAECTTPGLSDGRRCSICLDGYKPFPLEELGHTFAFGDPDPTCTVCSAKGSIIINSPTFPVIVDNTYRIDGGIYRVKQKPNANGNWDVVFVFNYTNISSNTAYLCPHVSVRGDYNKQAICTHGQLQPNESGTFMAESSVNNPNGTYCVVFD